MPRYDAQTHLELSRQAFVQLASPVVRDLQGNEFKNEFYTQPKRISGPVWITQELPYTNTALPLIFDFSLNQPKFTTALNNRRMTLKQNACCFAIRFRIGIGATAISRYYRTYGPTSSDDAIYNTRLSWMFEQDQYISNMDVMDFYDSTTANQLDGVTSGVLPITPMRLFKGTQGVNEIKIEADNSLSGLTLTSGLYAQVSLGVVIGNAEG